MIEVSHITKRYGALTAVSDLSFTIEGVGVYGLLGSNGAGKTTTMNIMTGCIAATEGDVRINGLDIYRDASRAKGLIGYLPEQPPLYQDMTPVEYLRFVGRAKGLRGTELRSEMERAFSVTGLGDMRNRIIHNLSKGYRQRVGVAQALLGSPELIILDEPTVGLDPKQMIEIRELIGALGKEHTVILSSHILSEVRAVCGHIMIISKGRLVADDTPEALELLFAGDATLELTARATAEQVGGIIAGLGLVCRRTQTENGITRIVLETPDGEATAERVFFAFAEAGRPILSMTPARASLEDVFLELTGDSGEAEKS